MPTKKYLVETDKGKFQVEVEDNSAPRPSPLHDFRADVTPHTPRQPVDEGGKPLDAAGKPRDLTFSEHVAGMGDNPVASLVANTLMLGATTGSPGELSSPSLLRGFKRVLGGAAEAASPKGEPLSVQQILKAPGRFYRGGMDEVRKTSQPRSLVERYSSNQSAGSHTEFGPSASTGPSAEALKELPLAEQMNHFPDLVGQGSTRTAVPPRMAVSHRMPSQSEYSGPGQVVGKAPKLEDALTQIIDSIRAESPSPQSSTTVPTLETAGAGPLKQSGKFPKSEQVGQPGGFSSGRPAISDQDMEGLVQRFGGRKTDDPAVASSPPAVESAAPTAETLPSTEPTSDVVRNLVRQVGRREAARRLYGSGSKSNVDRIITHFPEGYTPQRPLEAEQRIMDAIQNSLKGEDK